MPTERTCGQVRYTNPRLDDSARPLINGDTTAITRREKEMMLIAAAFPEPPAANGVTVPPDGSTHNAIDSAFVGRILAGCSNQSAPGEDRMRTETVKVKWDPERITNLTRLCIKAGSQPEGWKTAKGIVIPKPGKPDYRQVRAHRVIDLLDSLGKLAEKTAATS